MKASTNENSPELDALLCLLGLLRPQHYAGSGDRDRLENDMAADGYMFRIGPYVIGIAEIDREDEQ